MRAYAHGEKIFGFLILSEESGWLVKEADPWGELGDDNSHHGWSIECEERGLLGGIHRELLFSTCTTDWERELIRELGFTKEQSVLEKSTGLSFAVCEHHEKRNYILTSSEAWCNANFTEANRQLNWAFEVLELTPLQTTAQFLTIDCPS